MIRYLMAILCVLSACKSVPMKEPVKPASSSTRLESVIEHVDKSVSDIEKDAGSILAKTEVVKQSVDGVIDMPSVPEEAKPPLREAVVTMTEVQSLSNNITESAKDVKTEADTLKKLHDQVDKLENQIIDLQSALNKSRLAALEKLYGYITMFWVIGFVLIAAGAAVAFFLNKGYGASLGLIGLLMIGFASASQYYLEEIALIGAVIVVLGFLVSVSMIAWSAINSKRSTVAVREIVEMIEILKESMTDSEKERIFGKDGIATRIQSDLTKEIVNKIREKNGFKNLKEIREAAGVTGASG